MLKPTLVGMVPGIEVAGVLQLLEAQRASGRFWMGTHALQFRDGRVSRATGEPVETVVALLKSTGKFFFRSVPGQPSGTLNLSVTGLLLEAARIADEAQVATL